MKGLLALTWFHVLSIECVELKLFGAFKIYKIEEQTSTYWLWHLNKEMDMC